ncbi:MAG TPA: hypothetical protein VHS59_08670, partial [Bacillota bacterium]|nr:hypothetical protein [Bacillota bacterium]
MMKTIPGDNRGSITLEACVVFPAFLAFLLFLVNMLNLCAVYLAMDHALSETVKQMAGEAYGQKGLS